MSADPIAEAGEARQAMALRDAALAELRALVAAVRVVCPDAPTWGTVSLPRSERAYAAIVAAGGQTSEQAHFGMDGPVTIHSAAVNVDGMSVHVQFSVPRAECPTCGSGR